MRGVISAGAMGEVRVSYP